MPWLWEAKKDVTSCEKLGGGATVDPDMSEWGTRHSEAVSFCLRQRQTWGTETS